MKRHASMNRAYRLVWSRVHDAWIAVAELSRGCGKGGRRRVVAAAALVLSSPCALAAPSGGEVIAGSGTITQDGGTTTINQNTQNLSLNWQSFNVAPSETVNFVQPSASAIAVNRILDPSGSQILGQINANGQVWLINPNGVLFGAGAQVNVGGLVASTLDVSDASLGSISRTFSGSGNGSVINQGTINGGYVALLGNTVSNQGTITSNGGTTALGAGSAVTLTFADNTLVQMQVEQNTLNNLAENGSLIRADGGTVILSAGAKDALLASVVNNSGIIEARSVRNVNGTIVLDGGNLGSVTNSGTLDASGLSVGESGGTVKMLGEQVALLDGAKVNVSGDVGGGTALIGGNYQGLGPEQNAQRNSMAAGAVINADAVSSGDGGLAVLWADGTTTMNGTITARGGINGGNGGQVETSGKQKLTVGSNARVNTLAPLGSAGNWLLDPTDFIIGNTGTQPGDILDTTLNTNLAGGNVTILSSQGASGTNGDIIVDGGVNWSANTTLTLSAYRNVTFSSSGIYIDCNAAPGACGIVLRADNTGTGVGTVYLTTNNAANYIAASPTGTMAIYYNPTSYASPTDYGQELINNGYGINGTLTTHMLVHINNSSATVNSKTYDGTTSATLSTPFTLNTALSAGTPTGATLTAGTATFADKNAGTGKTVTFTGYSASGSVSIGATGRVANYFLAGQPASKTGNINQKALTATVTATNKTYDGTTTATPTFTITSGLVGTETVTATGAATFADKNAGVGKTVTANSATLSDGANGGLASNYSLAAGQTTTANITPKALTATVTATSKTYDGTTTATPTFTITGGLVGAETVTATGAATFADKNAGVGKTVTANTVSLADGANGGLASNYSLAAGQTTTANITPKALTATVTATNKTYDGTTTATPTFTITSGLVGSETVTASGTATFVDKNAGTGKSVTANTVSLADGMNGGLASNYSLAAGQTTTADINKAAITVSGITAANKVYDATTAATTNSAGAVLTGKVGGDVVTVSATGTFADKNVANGKTVTLSSSYGGTDAGNYTFTDQTSTTANITPAAITVSGITAANKVYDTTTAATVSTAGAVLTGKLAGDVVTVSATGTFADKSVANGKTVTLVSSYGGTDVGNYTITSQATTSANITPASLTLGGITASNKVYDGTTIATLNTAGVTFTGLLAGDVVSLNGAGSGTFADKNVGTGKTVTVSGYTLGGADAGNYTVAQPTGLTANITAKAVTVSGITAANKVYDATTAATVNTAGAVFTGMVGGDTLNVAAVTGTFADKNVANGKTVTLSGTTYGGADAGNYTFTDQASTTANITPAALTVTANAASKSYGAADPVLTYTANFVGSDTAASMSGALSRAAGETVAGGPYAITQGSLANPNYTITFAGANFTINPASLTVTANNATMAANGSAYAGGNGVTYSGFMLGDSAAALSGTLAYGGTSQGARTPGTYLITPSGLNSSNYTLSYVSGTLTISAETPTLQYAVTQQQSSFLTMQRGVGFERSKLFAAGNKMQAGSSRSRTITLYPGILALNDRGPTLQIDDDGVFLSSTRIAKGQ